MTKIQYTNLAPNLQISKVLTGLWQIADMEKDGNTLDPVKTAPAMAPYFEAGLTTFDMADHYGSAEDIAGVFYKNHPLGNQAQLMTKWVPKPGPVTREGVRAAVEVSLKRMQRDHIDLLQFHAWNYADTRWLDCMFYLQELKEEGVIGHLGLTNVDAAHLRILLTSGIEIATNQVCYSLIDRRARGEMTELCEKYNVHLLAFGTLAGGFLTERWLGKPEPAMERLETWSQMKYKRFIDAAGGWGSYQDLLAAVDKAAKRHDVSFANIACRYMLEEPAVAGVIIGARLGLSSHVEDNLRLFSFELDAQSKEEIGNAIAHLSPIPGGCGDEYRKPPFLTAAGDLSDHFESMPAPFEVRELADRKQALSGTIWEDLAGFSRAVRKGNHIYVSGTTATHGSRAIGGKDPEAQAHFIIDKIEGALQSLCSKLEDVVRTRVFIHNLDDWEPVSRAHGARFGHIQPANTLVQAEIIGDDYLVEIEVDASV